MSLPNIWSQILLLQIKATVNRDSAPLFQSTPTFQDFFLEPFRTLPTLLFELHQADFLLPCLQSNKSAGQREAKATSSVEAISKIESVFTGLFSLSSEFPLSRGTKLNDRKSKLGKKKRIRENLALCLWSRTNGNVSLRGTEGHRITWPKWKV